MMVYYGLLWFIVVYDAICYCLLTPDPIQLSQKTWLRISMLGVFTKGLKMRGRMINSFGVSPSFYRSTGPSQDISRLLDRTKRGCQKIGQVMISNLSISKSGMALCIIAYHCLILRFRIFQVGFGFRGLRLLRALHVACCNAAEGCRWRSIFGIPSGNLTLPTSRKVASATWVLRASAQA